MSPDPRPRPITPFADETVLSIGELDIQNAADEIAITGSLTIRKDRASLAKLETLFGQITSIISALKLTPGLPNVAPAPTKKSVEMKNPFA